ncbi:hypothetical protein Y032_0333g2802 [Ancylostoma ceylanicum]|uniref:Uncharacterized protein n=1 Tax=Ancylostoma ceylanicum TaxID=53326 RepID=A0A016S015_9BILA|nr:hypothetical protein Y032_0333g2802 [Ancylostoma ceylanicum]
MFISCVRVSPDFTGGRGDRQFEMNQNEPAIAEMRIVEMIRIDCHVDRLERCQTELIADTLEDVPTIKWRWQFLQDVCVYVMKDRAGRATDAAHTHALTA